MDKVHTIKGFAFLCDSNGKILNVLRDDFGLADNEPHGKLFPNLVDKENRALSLSFLLEVKNQKFSLDYRLSLNVKGEAHSFYFIGIRLNKEMLIIGADNHKEAIDFANHLQQINNEQANLIRQLIKNNSLKANEGEKETEILFNEITQLNNELVNLQRELTQKNRELERLDELKNRFLGMAAHDLRNPLGLIMSYSDLIMDEGKDKLPDDLYKFITRINESSVFMLQMVEELLDVSRINAGKIDLKKESFDIVERTTKQLELLRTFSAKKNIEIKFDSTESSLTLFADIFKLDQVLNNLVTNAIKFSNPDSKIIVHLKQKQNSVYIIVQDFGIGIKEADIQKIFEPFGQVNKQGTAGEKSTGLGLSIVKRIIDSHGGSITVESKPEKGTTFSVCLPIKDATSV